jgi:hypothetical protein
MKLKYWPGTYAPAEVEGTPAEVAELLKALGTGQPVAAPILIPTIWTVDGCPQGGVHEYPTAWWSLTPPPCQKCGKVSEWKEPTWTVELNPQLPLATETVIQVGSPHFQAPADDLPLWRGEGP